jgi:hypothetical protein
MLLLFIFLSSIFVLAANAAKISLPRAMELHWIQHPEFSEQLELVRAHKNDLNFILDEHEMEDVAASSSYSSGDDANDDNASWAWSMIAPKIQSWCQMVNKSKNKAFLLGLHVDPIRSIIGTHVENRFVAASLLRFYVHHIALEESLKCNLDNDGQLLDESIHNIECNLFKECSLAVFDPIASVMHSVVKYTSSNQFKTLLLQLDSTIDSYLIGSNDSKIHVSLQNQDNEHILSSDETTMNKILHKKVLVSFIDAMSSSRRPDKVKAALSALHILSDIKSAAMTAISLNPFVFKINEYYPFQDNADDTDTTRFNSSALPILTSKKTTEAISMLLETRTVAINECVALLNSVKKFHSDFIICTEYLKDISCKNKIYYESIDLLDACSSRFCHSMTPGLHGLFSKNHNDLPNLIHVIPFSSEIEMFSKNSLIVQNPPCEFNEWKIKIQNLRSETQCFFRHV